MYQGTVITEMAIMVILSIVLNSYWFILMVNMIIRLIKKMQAPSEKVNEEKIELVKADSLAMGGEEADCATSTQGSNVDGGEIVEECLNSNIHDEENVGDEQPYQKEDLN